MVPGLEDMAVQTYLTLRQGVDMVKDALLESPTIRDLQG